MKFSVYNIVYETDGNDVQLPTSMVVECEDAFEIADAISDETGWLVRSFESDLIRGGYRFKDTFDAGLNRDTGNVDVYGVDVYDETGKKFQGHIDWVDSDILAEMTDEEFNDFIEENRQEW